MEVDSQTPTIRAEIRDVVEGELRQDETLLWAYKPEGIVIDVYDILALFIFTIAISSILPLVFPEGERLNAVLIDFKETNYFYFFTRLVPIVLGLECLRIILRIAFRYRHIYAITTKRILARTSLFSRQFYEVKDFQRVEVSMSEPRATITFVPKGETAYGMFWLNLESVGLAHRGYLWSRRKDKITKFYKIPNADFVEKLVNLIFLSPEENKNPGFTTSRRSRRRRRSML